MVAYRNAFFWIPLCPSVIKIISHYLDKLCKVLLFCHRSQFCTLISESLDKVSSPNLQESDGALCPLTLYLRRCWCPALWNLICSEVKILVFPNPQPHLSQKNCLGPYSTKAAPAHCYCSLVGSMLLVKVVTSFCIENCHTGINCYLIARLYVVILSEDQCIYQACNSKPQT